MSIKVNTKALSTAMQAAARVTPAKTPSEALLHARLFTLSGKLYIEATDYDVGGRWTVPCEGELPQCGVKATDFSALVKSLRGAETTLSFAQGRLSVASNGSKAHLPALDGLDVPRLPSREDGEVVTWCHADLCEALASVLPFVSSDETRPALTGVHFEGARLESSDGHCASVAAFQSDIPRKIIVPPKALREVMALQGCESVAVSLSGAELSPGAWSYSAIWIEGKDCAVYARLIDMSFPNVAQAIPPLDVARKGESTCTVDADAFAGWVKQAALFCDVKTNGVALDIKPDEIVITAQSDKGDIVDTQRVDVEGEGGAVRANWRYLMEAVKAARSPQVRIRVAGELAPILVQPDGREGRDGDVVVVMPMRM